MPDGWLPALVLMWLCAMPALGLPTPRRLPEPQALVRQPQPAPRLSAHRQEVLAGRDFLSVFMRTSSSHSASRHHPGRATAIGSDFSENSNSVHRVEGEERDINHKGENVLEATDYAEEFESARNFNSRDRFTEDQRLSLDAVSPTTTPIVTEIPTTTTTEIPSTTTPASEPEDEAAVSTFYDLDEENPSEIGMGALTEQPSFASYWARFTERASSTPPTPPPTPSSSHDNEQPLQVISVRVSSSVVRHSHKVDDHSTPKPFESEKLVKTASRLVTEEQPTLTAVQRSSLNVEEAPLIEAQGHGGHQVQSQHYAPYRPAQHPQVIPIHTSSTTETTPQTSTPPNSFGVRNLQKPASQTNGFSEQQTSVGAQYQSTDYHNSPEALAAVQEEINVHRTDFLKLKDTKPENRTHKVNRYELENKPRSEDDEGSDFVERTQPNHGYRQYGGQDKKEGKGGDSVTSYDNEPKALAYHYDPQNPQLSPVSYQTSVSSATSGSRVRFYSEPLGYRKASQRQTLEQQQPVEPTLQQQRPVTPERSYQQPERVYGVPEQNYEVDEAVSVVTNGRAHGVQSPAPGPSPPPSGPPRPGDSEDPNKSGYVLEGRNFRKYRVEEKTADGFIVGEYGVVSHDDGSLRGVRYTADSTINPRLIYDALVKFLSLK
ncbi:uncharacterized protein LOC111052859 [Nilaparvata lugens]|uniref:uncharacterized protein LOC111052859 n=1 Tax=Nilaparvata lugens TaxID=108931 RepID=UPI000B99691B|nr:uncharacterized protein LOC111052859 [Nilaparvata lugens]